MSYTRKRGIQLENDEEVPSKKVKGSSKRRDQTEEESSEEVPMKKKAAAQKASKQPTQGTDSDGNNYWDIGSNRRIGSSVFKNTTLVNIREYYHTADGEAKPGKKVPIFMPINHISARSANKAFSQGISLSLDQYKALLKVLPQLNEELRSKGHQVDDLPAAAAASTSAAPAKAEKASTTKKTKKSNIEETSDEDEGGMEEDDEGDV